MAAAFSTGTGLLGWLPLAVAGFVGGSVAFSISIGCNKKEGNFKTTLASLITFLL